MGVAEHAARGERSSHRYATHTIADPCTVRQRMTARRTVNDSTSIESRTMKIAFILFCAALAGAMLHVLPVPAVAGTIDGTVVNTSTGAAVPCQVAVLLQVQVKGEFVPFRDRSPRSTAASVSSDCL